MSKLKSASNPYWNCPFCNRYIVQTNRLSHIFKHKIKDDKIKFDTPQSFREVMRK